MGLRNSRASTLYNTRRRHQGCRRPPGEECWSIWGANLRREITLQDLAREAGTSVFHFARVFKRRTGISPHQYLLQRRVEEARSLLADRNLSITKIALRCGFAHPSHFSETVRRMTGVAPRVYRS
jgi:AraC family transcriptional regulator